MQTIAASVTDLDCPDFSSVVAEMCYYIFYFYFYCVCSMYANKDSYSGMNKPRKLRNQPGLVPYISVLVVCALDHGILYNSYVYRTPCLDRHVL